MNSFAQVGVDFAPVTDRFNSMDEFDYVTNQASMFTTVTGGYIIHVYVGLKQMPAFPRKSQA